MEKNRSRLIGLLLIFIAIFSLVVLQKNWGRIFPKKDNLVFPSLKKESINQLEIKAEKQTTKLYKKNSRWFLKKNGVEFQADQERIENLITNLLNLKKDNLVSNNKKRHKNFGIGQQKVVINEQQIYIGNSFATNKNYFRINDQNEVFAGENINDIFTPQDYRDLSTYLVNNEDKVTTLEISFDNKTILLSKKENNWSINKKKVKKERVDFFINDLKTLKANDVFAKETDLPVTAELIIKIKENNQNKSASFYLKDENNYLLKTSVSKLIYQIPAAYVASLKKEEKDFIE